MKNNLSLPKQQNDSICILHFKTYDSWPSSEIWLQLINKKINTLLCSPQCEKKIVKIWPNVQDWKLAVLHSVWITKNVSLKMFEISRQNHQNVLVSFLSENSKMFWKWDNFGICKHCVFSCKLILKGRNSAHAIHALFQNILLRSYFMVQHKIVN